MFACQLPLRRLALVWVGFGVVGCGAGPAPPDDPEIAVEIAAVSVPSDGSGSGSSLSATGMVARTREAGLSFMVGGVINHGPFVAIGSYRRFLGAFADSPIVADEGSPNQLFGGLALGYAF